MLAFFLAKLDDPNDKNIFQTFYVDHRQLMYRVAFRILKEKYLAEDAVQDAFLAILGQTEKLRGMDKGQKEGFAVVVTRNKAIDLLRRKGRVSYWEELPENALAVELELDESDHIFGQLPYQYSYVLKLIGLGFRPAEIASLTNREIDAVYKQISRGRELLREILEKEGYRGLRSDRSDAPTADSGMGGDPA